MPVANHRDGIRIERKLVAILNAFCPTGEGGGVDPSCSSETGGSEDSPGLHEVPMTATHARKVKGIAVDLASRAGVSLYASDSSKPIVSASDTPGNRKWFNQFKGGYGVGGGQISITFGKRNLKILDSLHRRGIPEE